jgi:peptidase S41-like protein/tricorn protease-like protein
MLSANKMGIHEGRTYIVREVCVKQQSITQRRGGIFAFLLAGAIFSVFPASTYAQAQPSTHSLDGLWLTDGYGKLVEFKGDELRSFEITKRSCIPVGKATRKSGVDTDKEIVFADEGDVTRVTPGNSQDTRWLHEDGSVSSILLRRTASKPEVCGQTLADAPMTNYEVFWETFAEHYPFFALRKMDWLAVDKEFRPRVTPATKPEELFRILSDMIDPLHDAHTFINAKSIQQRFHGYRPAEDPMQKKNAARIAEIIEKQYVRGGLRDFCNKQLQFGMLNSSVGYLRIHSFSRYSEDKEFAKQLEALENALDAIFKDAAKWTGLVIDVRINGGGSDVFGISIASRLATQEYVGYSKVIRNDIQDPNHRTPPQPVIVHVSQRPSFRGPVVLLTSADSVSAAETFTMAVLDRQPHVTRVGANTQGVFSDILVRKLPNGWSFGLPNEIYLTKDGMAFDGTGVPADLEVPIFFAEDLASGRDSALNKALELLASRDH